MSGNMNKYNTDDISSEPEEHKKFTMKVLFGPMFGCELHLPASEYFLIIGQGLAFQEASSTILTSGEHAATYTQNTLFIPCDMPSPNIILHLSAMSRDENGHEGYCIEVQGCDKNFSVLLKENELFVYEHICFAIKRCEDEWSDDIKNFNLSSEIEGKFGGQKKKGTNKKKRSFIVSTIILLSLIMVAGIIPYKKWKKDQKTLMLSEVLVGAPMPIKIVHGRDNNLLYVLTQDIQAMEWAKEALFKLKKEDSVVLVWLFQQKKEVVSQLANAGYPILQINYTDPQHPIVALYRELRTQEELRFKSIILQKIPFALDIKFLVKNKDQLLQEARQGLDRLNIYYRQINTSDGYALVVRDALSDSVLQDLQHFIKQFNHRWGNSIINISINLDENWLQNKSYVDSSKGYLFLNPRHWYFPLKQGD